MREVVFYSAHIDGDEESFVVFCYDGGTEGMFNPVSITCADTGKVYSFCQKRADGAYQNTDWIVDDVRYDFQTVTLRLKPIGQLEANHTDVSIGSMVYAGDSFENNAEETITVRLHSGGSTKDFTA